jgi:hypothetical protein
MVLLATPVSLHCRFPSQISSAIDQLGEVGRTDEPGRLLAAEAEDPAGQQLRGRTTARLLETQAEIFWGNLRQENIGLSEFGQ